MANTILYAKVERINHDGNVIDMASLDQRGLAIVRKWNPNAVGEKEVTEISVKRVPNAKATAESSKSEVSGDGEGSPKRGRGSRKPKLADDAAK